MLARFQGLAGLAQTGPTLVAMPILAVTAAHAGLRAALAATSAVLVLTSALTWRASRLP